MKRELFPYQIEGARWLAGKKTALLADAPRLGKAVQAITALDHINAQSALVVCRGVARANWQDEIKLWSRRPWRTTVVFGTSSRVDWFSPGIASPHLIITSYESLRAVLDEMPVNLRFCAAVIDESHYVKNLEAKRTQLVLGKNGVPSRANRVWCTTGTPTPNGLASELWPVLFTFGLTKLSFWDFAKYFCVVQETGYGDRIVGTRMDKVRELQALMAPKFLRRTPEDVSVELPKMSFSTVMVKPGVVHLREHKHWAKWAIPFDRTKELNQILEQELGVMNGIMGKTPEEKELSPELLELLKANAKSISTLRRYTALQKIEPACELIMHELSEKAYAKCVVFAHHADVIKGVQMRLAAFHPVTLYGGSNPKRVALNIKHFQNPKHKVRVFIGQISAAGTSISLSAANHNFFLEESFTPDDNAQAAMRCGGVNQPKPIFVRTFCLENSYDYRLQNILRQKTAQSAAILNFKSDLPDLPADMI